jgi:uncharacterized metal-binding protein YceD (DUF177 family)
MKVYFHEIKEHDLEYHFNESTPWVMDVVGALDERMDGITRPANWKPRSRPTEVSFTLRRVEDLIHVTGKIKTQLYLLCSLCADAFQFPINTHFHVLLTQSTIYTDTPRESNSSHKGSFDSDEERNPLFMNDDDDDLDDEDDEDDETAVPMNLNSSDFEVNVVTEPLADLKEIMNEQIVLVLPPAPKPEKDEKDDCVKCGRNQATYLPQKEELIRENPFAVLKNFKKKPDEA